MQNSVRLTPCPDRFKETPAEPVAQKLVKNGFIIAGAVVLQAVEYIIDQFPACAGPILLVESAVPGDPEFFPLLRAPAPPDILEGRLIGEDSLDQGAQLRAELLRVSLMRQTDEKTDRLRVKNIRTFRIVILPDAVCAIFFQNDQVRCAELLFRRHHRAVTSAARPVEFVVEPEGGEGEFLPLFQKAAAGVEPFPAHVLQLAAGARINQVLRKAGLPKRRKRLPDQFSRRFPRHRPHRNQRALPLFGLHHLPSSFVGCRSFKEYFTILL